MSSSYAELDRKLTAPGQFYEMESQGTRSGQVRLWKNAPRNLREIFLAGRQFSDRPYLRYREEVLTFDQHFAQVTRFAQVLKTQFGVETGDRVAIAMRNYPEWSVAFWAIVSIGAVVVPVNAWLGADEVVFVLEDSGSTVLVADEPRARQLLSVGCPTALVNRVVVVRAEKDVPGSTDFSALLSTVDADAGLPDGNIESDDPATIFYTSGTTGTPKGALGTHRNICNAQFSSGFASLRSHLRNGGTLEEFAAQAGKPLVCLLTVPLFHVTGCIGALVNLYSAGGLLVMMHKWDPEAALDLIERERVTFFLGVPTMAWQLIEIRQKTQRDLSSLQSLAYGGAAAAPELLRRLQEQFPQTMINTGYGITEASSTISSIAGGDYLAHPDSVGAPLPVYDVNIVDHTGNPVGIGERGEIWLRGPGVVACYWKNEQASSEAMIDGWFKTGDIGYRDASGLLYIVDRLKDMVIRGGENVYSAEVEAALVEIPGVKAAAIVGLPHAQLGEEVGAIVELEPEADFDAVVISDFLADRLAKYKRPTRWWVRREPMPLGATGKILKRELKDAWVANPELDWT